MTVSHETLIPNPGEVIERERVKLGLSRRKMASKLGISTRQMRALEADKAPEPRFEKRQWYRKEIPFLGYAVWVYEDWAVPDRKFDLEVQQQRAIDYFRTGELTKN